MTAWLVAFAATCAVELAVVRALMPAARVRVVLVAQLATHPLVWIAMAALPGPQLARLAVVELWAATVEAAIYARWLALPGRDAFALSAAANAASLLAVALF
jgi:hypothetical protein